MHSVAETAKQNRQRKLEQTNKKPERALKIISVLTAVLMPFRKMHF